MKKEFKATHYWKQYPKIEFEINENTGKARVKGQNDMNPSNWVTIYEDRNGINYFTVKHERIYFFDIAKY